jgi:Flp pilus assembly protein TadG
VEFAIVMPVLMMLVLGMLTFGMALDRQMTINNAGREAARYGATVAETQPFASGTWASNVREVAVQRSSGQLEGPRVCVALVTGQGTAVAVSPAHTTRGGTEPCFAQTDPENRKRVQVEVQRDVHIDVLVFARTITLTSRATATFEDPGS